MLIDYTYTPGTRVGVWVHGGILHEGIASDRFIGSDQAIINCSARTGAVCEESANEFSGGRPIFLLDDLSTLDDSLVLKNARLRLGKTWDLLRYNCQHFTRECYGVPASSPQVTLGAMIIAGAAGYAIAKAVRR